MHTITGLAIAALARRLKRDKWLAGLPRYKTGPIRVAHAIPGRIRFLVPSLRGDDSAGLSWLERLRDLQGVSRVDVSSVTGSVLVIYRPAEVDPALLFGALARLLGLEGDVERTPAPVMLRELREFGKSLNLAVYDNTSGLVDLWSLLIIGFVVLGVKGVYQRGWASLPAGVTLLWWALNSASRGRGGGV
jgi:hypothetical protein